jgi:hypothetical protein
MYVRFEAFTAVTMKNVVFWDVALCRPCVALTHLVYIYKNRDSVVGIATGDGLDDRGVGVRLPVGSRIFSSPLRPDRLWGPHPASYPMGTGALSPELKRPGREADHSPPTSAEVKKMWIVTSTPPYAFMA